MATLTVSKTTDYRFLVFVNVDAIDFTNLFLSGATATFSASQFGAGKILPNVAIDGSGGFNTIAVTTSTTVPTVFSAAGWTFTNWSVQDRVFITANGQDDTLTGSAKADTISSGGGNDVINGGGGADTITAGAGNDTIILDDTNDVSIDGGNGFDTLRAVSLIVDLTDTVYSNIENLLFEGSIIVSVSSQLVASGGLTTITGSALSNRVEFVGGTSIDLSGLSFVSWTENVDQVDLFGDHVLANTLTGTSYNDEFTGGGASDTMTGGAGDDIFTGFGGADVLSGNGGNDTFRYGVASGIEDTIDGGGGTDSIVFFGNFFGNFAGTAISSVEQLDFGTQSVLAGFLGTQIGKGGGRISSVVAHNQAVGLAVSGSDVNLTGVTFSGWASGNSVVIAGLADAANALVGSVVKDQITGGALDDVIRGGAGGDTLDGGGGSDTLSYQGAVAAVTVNLDTSSASGGDANGDSFSGFENVAGGSGNDTLTGSAAVNVISGGAGNDQIRGGQGADVLAGGSGNDTFFYDADDDAEDFEQIDGGAGTADMISLTGGDTQSYGLLFATVTNVEILKFNDGEFVSLGGAAIGGGPQQIATAIGSAGNDKLVVQGSNVDLSGLIFQTWAGLFGGDQVFIYGDFSNDTLIGSSSSDMMIGFAGADIMNGGAGFDMLTGAGGSDTLTGGADVDSFMFGSVNDSAVGGSRDVITDFEQGTDAIDVSAIDAVTGGTDDIFVWRGTKDFTAAGQLRYFINASGNTVIEGDVDGGGADFQIELTGSIHLAGADFTL